MQKYNYFNKSGKRFYLLCLGVFSIINVTAQTKKVNSAVITEQTPSRAQYFNWINSTNEGTTEQQTLINLDFFKWLQNTYGMTLDIYAFDAGVIDGRNFYGSMDSERFKSKFPTGFGNVFQKAKEIKTRLGLWGGPDGFGDTRETAEARKEMMISLCRDYEFELFKFDGVCGPLRQTNDTILANMLETCRQYSPSLILLNHRLDLGKAAPYATTYLWEGRETYIDVFTQNNTTAPHNRAGALSFGLTRNLERLVEDCGVCISSCLDSWDDELVLQAFNRSLILAPEVYGNPWLLRDDEFPKLARIYNLHRKYGQLLVEGFQLPTTYGIDAVSRGDEKTRLLTLKNLSWEPKMFTVSLNSEIGLKKGKQVHVRSFHPTERIIGDFQYGKQIEVMVPPFRSMLLFVSSDKKAQDAGIEGVDFQVIKDNQNSQTEIKLIGLPGSLSTIKLPDYVSCKQATLEGQDVSAQLKKGVSVSFEGDELHLPFHREVVKLERVSVTPEVSSLYEATVFAADNNALEVRSLFRSGETALPEVKAARDAFFNQSAFVERGIWDKNLFDGDMSTGFWCSRKYDIDQRVKQGCFRLDLGENMYVDSLVIRVNDMFALEPLRLEEGNFAQISSDLTDWKQLVFISQRNMQIHINGMMRYLKMPEFPAAISEIEVYTKGIKLNNSKFKASNLFADSKKMDCKALWTNSFTLNEMAPNSYLSVAVNGEHGVEGAYAAFKVDGRLVGAPSRAVSYPSNTWEYVNAKSASNYTYYFPLTKDMIGKKIEVFVMGYESDKLDITPEVWISSYNPYMEKTLLIEK